MTKPAQLRPITAGQLRAARMLGDELLAKLVARGSHHAFAALCERHSHALHRYCLSILRHEHDAQDALQSTMTQAYAALRACERDVSLRAWLFRIAHNESVTILRKRARQPDPDQTGVARSRDPHSVFEERARLTQLVADLHALPERQRATEQEQGEPASPEHGEHGSAGSPAEGGNEQGRSGAEHAHGGGGKGRSEQSDE